MDQTFLDYLQNEIDQLKEIGLYKEERVIASPQQADITLSNSAHVLNFCSNNYLGLANHPDVIKAAADSLRTYGFGLASVRFICGTQTVHIELEKKLSSFLGTESTILYSSCFDANGGLFETVLGPEDAVISDALNHASIIDGIRLCKAKRLRYQNNNMHALEERLKEAQDARFRLIATDGAFSMDGIIANLPAICDLADRYHALVMMDDCHTAGF
jgi:glycine C-acetyltransferase